MTERDSFEPTPEQDIKIEDLADKRGISYEMARRVFFGAKIEVDEPAPKPSRKPRHSGNVRDFESDRDHELAEERAAYEPLTEAQRETNRRGVAMARKAIAGNIVDRIIERTRAETDPDPDYGDIHRVEEDLMLDARLRTYFDREEARKDKE